MSRARNLAGFGSAVTSVENPVNIRVGYVTAIAYYGDGSELTGTPGGLGTALSDNLSSPLNKIYYTNANLSIASTINVDPPESASAAYTQYTDIVMQGDADLIVGDGDDFIPDILGIGTFVDMPGILAGGNGKVRAANYTDKLGSGAAYGPYGFVTPVGVAVTVGSGTSISSPATNTLALGTNSVERVRINSVGNFGIGTNNPAYKLHIGNGTSQANLRLQSGNSDISLLSMIGGTSQTCRIEFGDSGDDDIGKIYYDNSDNSMQFATNTSESFRIDSSQRILKGWGSTTWDGPSNGADICIAGTASNDGIQVGRYNTSYGSYGLTMFRSRGTSVGTNLPTLSNDDVGHIGWWGDDGTNWKKIVEVTGACDGNTDSSSSPGKIIFKTTKDSATSPTQAMTIKADHNVEIHDGNLVFETSGTGIDFSATGDAAGATSELLDDYEEGTWNPTSNTGTISNSDANYVKIGSYVHVGGYVRFDDVTTASDVIITNLPFTASHRSSGAVFAGYLDSGKVPNACYASPGTNKMYFYISGNAGVNYAALEHDEISSAQNQFFFGLGYRTNS